MKFKVVESLEKQLDVEYKGITIEHFLQNMEVYNKDDFTNKFYDFLDEKLLSAKLKKYDGIEGKKKYIHDFMKSDDAIKEFPDVKQRYAVCMTYWNNR